MIILLTIFKVHLNIIYAILKLFPTKKNRVLFLSRQFDHPSNDFLLIKDELLRQDSSIEIRMITRKIGKSIPKKICYYFVILRQMYHIATSKTCVVDSYIIPVSILNHKKSLKVIQIWHATSAVKKFGYQTLDKQYGRDAKIANIMKMHNNYDIILSGSKEMIKYFSEAYNTDESKFVVLYLPSIEYTLKNKEIIKNKILTDYPDINSKPIVLYAPTFRVNEDVDTSKIISAFDFDNYNLVIKSHPSKKIPVDDKRVYKCKYSSQELLTIADYVVTDYSSIAIEAAIMSKKLYFFVYDYEDYKNKNGVNIDLYEEMKDMTFSDANDLMNSITNIPYNVEEFNAFQTKYTNDNSSNATFKLANYIINNDLEVFNDGNEKNN